MIDGWGDGETLTGHIQRLEPAAFTRVSALGVEEQRVNVIIGIDRAPPELGDGYRVDARIVVWEQPNTVLVPVSALFRDGAELAVYVVRDGRAELRHVRIGEQGGTDAQVLSGLASDDRVVVFPSDQMKPGRGGGAARLGACVPHSPPRSGASEVDGRPDEAGPARGAGPLGGDLRRLHARFSAMSGRRT